MHIPLKSSRMKRRTTSPLITGVTTPSSGPNTPPVVTPGESTESASTVTAGSYTPTSIRSPIFRISDSETAGLSSLTLQEEEDTGCISSESECIVSDPTGITPDLSPDRKVQFVVGSAIDDIAEDEHSDSLHGLPKKNKKYKKG